MPHILANLSLAGATLTASAVVVASGADASPSEYQKLERGAMAGNYQDQRNLAYWLTGGYGGAAPQNAILACAWRQVILASGDRQVDQGDVSNKQLYCDRRLDSDSQKAAKAQAEKLMAQIKKRK
ncbi:hypothetical protein LJR175_008199 [Variovorax sp. LjRoot175]|uniref:hypothetical protein n=1 Tax=Variovorax sp. LjRoot175 TaxID=3342276 RepID=UPI003ED06F6D